MRILILLLTLMKYSSLINGYNYTELKEPKGIFIIKTYDTYIVYNQWKLVYTLKLDEIYDDFAFLKGCVTKIQSICPLLKEKNCDILQEKLERNQNNLEKDIQYIETFYDKPGKNRNKRGAPLGFLGAHYYKPLFGIMDENDAMEIHERLNKLIAGHNQQQIFMGEEMSIIQQTIEVTNNTIKTLWDKITAFQDQLNSALEENAEQVNKNIDILYLSNTATLIIIEQNYRVKVLKDLLKNVYNGDIHDLVPWKQLKTDLNKINDELDGSNYIISQTERETQSLLSIKGTIIYKTLLVEITIPAINKDPYKLTKVTTLPITLNNETILIDTENKEYLINDKLKEYIPIADFELKQCKAITKNRLICSPQTQAYLKNEESCESEIVFGGNLNNILRKCDVKFIQTSNYIKHLEENIYYIFTNNILNITEKCQSKPKQHTKIDKVGILTLQPSCEIQINDIKISARSVHSFTNTTTIDSPYEFSKISPKNLEFLSTHIRKLSLPKLTLFIDYDKDFQKLMQDANDLKVRIEEKGEKLSFLASPVQISYGFAMAIILLIILCKALYNYFCR